MTDFDPAEARTSEWALCPRCCACRIAGCEPSPPNEYMMRYLRRGQLMELYVVQQFRAKYGSAPGDVVHQLDIDWPLGTAHADIWIPDEKLLVEVFSTTGGNLDRKIKQVKLYGYFFPEAEKLAVYVIDPSTLEREDLIPVKLTDEDREQIGSELAMLMAVSSGAVESLVDSGPTRSPLAAAPDLPPCVFNSPSECKFAGCAFTESAWADWEAAAYELDDALPLVEQLAAQTDALREAEKEVRIRREQTLATKQALARAGLEPGCDYIIGPYQVRRTLVGPRHTFSLSTAKKAGYELPEHLQAFVKVGEGHERYNIKVMEGAA